jgi:hypothetical protein
MLGPNDVDWTDGRTLAFRERGRTFFIGVVLPREASPRLRQAVRRILDSIRVGKGRCQA